MKVYIKMTTRFFSSGGFLVRKDPTLVFNLIQGLQISLYKTLI